MVAVQARDIFIQININIKGYLNTRSESSSKEKKSFKREKRDDKEGRMWAKASPGVSSSRHVNGGAWRNARSVVPNDKS